MAESLMVTTDAQLKDVLQVLDAAGVCRGLTATEGIRDTYRFGTPEGAYVTVFWDLKLDIDEYETVVDIYDAAAPGSAVRLFEVIAEGVEQKVTLFAPDDTDVVASSENGIVEWRMSREEALRMGMQN